MIWISSGQHNTCDDRGHFRSYYHSSGDQQGVFLCVEGFDLPANLDLGAMFLLDFHELRRMAEACSFRK